MENNIDTVRDLYEKGLLEDNEEVLLSNGFDSAILGVTASEPKAVIYDYYRCIDIVMKTEPDLELEDVIEWLHEHMSVELGKQTPIFIKRL